MNLYYSPDLLFVLFFVLSGILIIYAVISTCCCKYDEAQRNPYTERTCISASHPNYPSQQQTPGYYATSSLGIYSSLPDTYSAYTQVPNASITPIHQPYPNYQPRVQVQAADQRPPTYQEVTRITTEPLQKQAPYNPYNTNFY